MNAPRSVPRVLRAVRTAAGLLAASALAGCGTYVGTDYVRPEVKLPGAWRGAPPESTSPAAPAAAVAVTPPAAAVDPADTAWWRGFGHPELDALVADALENNRDLKVALARVREVDAKLAVARSADKPQVGAGFTGNRTRRSLEQPDQYANFTSPDFNAFQLGINLSWEIDLWGKIRRANEAALADLMATQAMQRGVMLSVVTGVASAYVELIGLDRQLELTREVLRNRQETLAVFELRRSGGLATSVQVLNAKADVEAVQAEIPEIERRILGTEALLALLSGRETAEVRRRPLATLALPAVPAGLPSDLLSRRPDVMQAEQAFVAANARIGVAEGERLPSVSLTGAFGVASDSLRWLLARTARAGEFARGIAGPLYTAGRLEGNIDAATAARDAAAETFQKAVQTGLLEVEQALVDRTKSAEQGRAWARQIATLGEGERQARLRFQGGQSTRLEPLDAERRRIEAEGREALSRQAEFAALVAVYKAMGGGWMDEQNRLREERLAARDVAAAAPAAPHAARVTPAPAAPVSETPPR